MGRVGGDAGEGRAELVNLPFLSCFESRGLVFCFRGDVECIRVIYEFPTKRRVVPVVVGSRLCFGDLGDVLAGILVSETESKAQIFALEIRSLVFDVCWH